jgi:hypothetical protein
VGCCNGGINLEGGQNRELGALASLSAERAIGRDVLRVFCRLRVDFFAVERIQLKCSAYTFETERRRR